MKRRDSLFLPPRAEQIMVMPAQTSPTRRWTLEEFYEARDAAPQGVRYEVVDDRAQVIERWRPDDDRPEIVSEQLEWRPEGAREAFLLDLPKFFAEFLPEDD